MSGKNKTDSDQDCECYIKTHTCPPVRNVTHPLRYYEFTKEEVKALEECDKESFYQRCVPFSTLFASLTYAAIKYGYLGKSPHFGAVPKVLVAAFIGHLFGRISYNDECEAKLRRLSNQSYVGNVLRKYETERNPPPKK